MAALLALPRSSISDWKSDCEKGAWRCMRAVLATGVPYCRDRSIQTCPLVTVKHFRKVILRPLKQPKFVQKCFAFSHIMVESGEEVGEDLHVGLRWGEVTFYTTVRK